MSPGSLRIALNATAAVTGGGVTYWKHLLPCLASLDAPHQYLVLAAAHQGRLSLDLPPNFRIERIEFGRPIGPRRALWEQTVLPRLLKTWKIDVLLAPGDMAPLLTPCPVVLGVMNSNPYWGPRGSTWTDRLRDGAIRRLTVWSARRSERVFFISQDSRRRIAPLLGLADKKTRVIYNGVGPDFHSAPAAAALHPPGVRYILSVSAIRIHKDFATLLRAFAALRREFSQAAAMELRIVGAKIDPSYYERLTALTADLGIKDAVVFAGEVPHEDLPPLYREAGMLVLPSFAETFGYPLVEAMASGLPIVATDLGVTREICGEAALYYEAGSPDSLLARMKELLAGDPATAGRIAAGKLRAQAYSWDRCAQATLELLEEAAAVSQSSAA